MSVTIPGHRASVALGGRSQAKPLTSMPELLEKEIPWPGKPVSSEVGVFERGVMPAVAKGNALEMFVGALVTPNCISTKECPTFTGPDNLPDGLPELGFYTLSSSEEWSDSDEELMEGMAEDCQERWIPKGTRYCDAMLSTACPICKDLKPLWRPLYPVRGISKRHERCHHGEC